MHRSSAHYRPPTFKLSFKCDYYEPGITHAIASLLDRMSEGAPLPEVLALDTCLVPYDVAENTNWEVLACARPRFVVPFLHARTGAMTMWAQPMNILRELRTLRGVEKDERPVECGHVKQRLPLTSDASTALLYYVYESL